MKKKNHPHKLQDVLNAAYKGNLYLFNAKIEFVQILNMKLIDIIEHARKEDFTIRK